MSLLERWDNWVDGKGFRNDKQVEEAEVKELTRRISSKNLWRGFKNLFKRDSRERFSEISFDSEHVEGGVQVLEDELGLIRSKQKKSLDTDRTILNTDRKIAKILAALEKHIAYLGETLEYKKGYDRITVEINNLNANLKPGATDADHNRVTALGTQRFKIEKIIRRRRTRYEANAKGLYKDFQALDKLLQEIAKENEEHISGIINLQGLVNKFNETNAEVKAFFDSLPPQVGPGPSSN